MSLADITDPQAVLAAVAEYDQLGQSVFLKKYGFGLAKSYFLVLNGRRYDSKAIVGAAHGFQYPNRGPLSAGDFSGETDTVKRKLEALGFDLLVTEPERVPVPMDALLVEQEMQYRLQLWQKLLDKGGPRNIAPQVIRDLRIHIAQQGIWTDKERTMVLTGRVSGVTLAVRHTGSSYSDDLSEDGIIYHYPETGRLGHDHAEVEATKWAAQLKLPVFVVTTPPEDDRLRNVFMGWVEDWDDAAKIFLISFGEVAPELATHTEEEESSFILSSESAAGLAVVKTRPGQQRFKFSVFKRYGPQCAVCNLNVIELLDAAHIRPKGEKGTDDPRNGIVLCATHHRAFDAGLFWVNPDTFDVVAKSGGPSLNEIGISVSSLVGLPQLPHLEALRWRWRRFANTLNSSP